MYQSKTGGTIVVTFSRYFLPVVLALFSSGASFSSQSSAPNEFGNQVYQVVEGKHVSIELVTYPEKYQSAFRLGGDSLLGLFTANPDSTFWYGPSGPNPYSWLSHSVVVLKHSNFQIQFCSSSGDLLDTLEFRSIEPGPYRIRVGKENHPGTGKYKIRVFHKGKEVDGHTVSIFGP